jgi:hypothetical protein
MLRLIPVATNVTELTFVTTDHRTVRVLFSYRTPVAALVSGQGYIRTKERHSATSVRHASQWLGGADVELVEQEVLDKLITNVSITL